MKATLKLIVSRLFLTLLIGGGTVSVALGQGTLSGTATLTGVQNGSLYDYTLTLNNTGTLPIGTLWYAWVPGGFFLPSNPTGVTAPSGWTGSIVSTSDVGISSYTAYSVRWVAGSGYALAAGSQLSLGFSSPDAPATLAGNVPNGTSNPYGGTPVGTSYIYENGPLTTPSYEFVAKPVPEPSALALLTLGFLSLASLWMWKWREAGLKRG